MAFPQEDAMTKCLLVSPRFPELSYWNYREVCELFGARYPAAPLGLVTAAALLPEAWQIRLLDLNVREMDTALLDWADIVMAGGMIPQQRNLLSLIDLCHARGKRIVVGGQDPTSQPDVYATADYLVLDEGELTIPTFLADLEAGATHGIYRSTEKPDVTQSPKHRPWRRELPPTITARRRGRQDQPPRVTARPHQTPSLDHPRPV